MKTIKLFTALAVIALLSASCVEKSNKYKDVIAQRDSIANEKQILEERHNQTIGLLDDIESGFASINENETQLQLDLQTSESPTTDRKKAIGIQMNAIKESMEKNKAKIAELRVLVSKKGKDAGLLSETIKRIQSQMDEKDLKLQTLQTELESKNIKIAELNTTVGIQSKNIIEQTNTIMAQEADMNTAWYCIASSRELKDAKILSGGGLFQVKRVMEKDFDQQSFTRIDLRTTLKIATNNSRAKVLSSHPQDSYLLEEGEDKNITIKITNPSKFWSVSKYLVVQI